MSQPLSSAAKSNSSNKRTRAMDYTGIELKVISCKNLKVFNFFQKLCVYAVVTIAVAPDDDSHHDPKKQKPLHSERTPSDRDGEGDPEWNHPLCFNLANFSARLHSRLLIRFDIRCESTWFSDRVIGEVHVPMKELIEEFNGAVRFVSYQVRNSDSKAAGVLNLSYEMKGEDQNLDTDNSTAIKATPEDLLFDWKLFKYPSLEVREKKRKQEPLRYPSTQWPILAPPTLVQAICNYRTYSLPSSSLQTGNEKDLNGSPESKGYGHKYSRYSMVG